MSAEIHAKIAKAVYPDADISIDEYGCKTNVGPIFKNSRYCHNSFDLLEAYEDGVPTNQAKASALDVLVWYRMNAGYDYFRGCGYGSFESSTMMVNKMTDVLRGSNPCAAIYEAAKEIVSE